MALSAEPKMVAYQVTNVVNGKSYIGITRHGLKRREGQHRSTARRGEGRGLHRAMRKYGPENFTFEIIAEFEDPDLMIVYEQEAIAKYKPEYNMTHGGEGVMFRVAGYRSPLLGKPSPLKGRPFSEEHRQNLSKAMTGVKRPQGRRISEAHKQAISAASKGKQPFLGKKHSGETKAKQRAAGLGRVRSELWVAVMCVNDGRVFAHAGLAAEFYGVQRAWLRMCINRNRAMANGLRFVDVPKDIDK